MKEYKEPFVTIEYETEEDYNYIKEAVAFYEKHKWKKVGDGLPENDDFVLAIANGECNNVKFVNAIVVAAPPALDGDGWWVEGWPDWENPNITHWMPLPEPPEEG